MHWLTAFSWAPFFLTGHSELLLPSAFLICKMSYILLTWPSPGAASSKKAAVGVAACSFATNLLCHIRSCPNTRNNWTTKNGSYHNFFLLRPRDPRWTPHHDSMIENIYVPHVDWHVQYLLLSSAAPSPCTLLFDREDINNNLRTLMDGR